MYKLDHFCGFFIHMRIVMILILYLQPRSLKTSQVNASRTRLFLNESR
jgi:hypothetical protein